MNDNPVFIEHAVVVNQAVGAFMTISVIRAGAAYCFFHPRATVLVHAFHFLPSGQRGRGAPAERSGDRVPPSG